MSDTELVILSSNDTLEDANYLCSLLSPSLPSAGVVVLTNMLESFRRLRAVIFPASFGREDDVKRIRRAFPTSFIALFRPEASEIPTIRLSMFEAGANMVAHDVNSLIVILQRAVLLNNKRKGNLICPYCGLSGLTEDDLWYHFPAFHINWPNENSSVQCPICGYRHHEPLQVHIHESHGPVARRDGIVQRKSRVHSYTFSLVVCRHPLTNKYLLCQEFGNQGYWLPGGAVDAGESLTSAAIRETKEEAGIDIELKGILGIEYDPREGNRSNGGSYVRMRVIFYAEPIDNTQLPKSLPDFESAGACWCSEEEIKNILKLRGNEVSTLYYLS